MTTATQNTTTTCTCGDESSHRMHITYHPWGATTKKFRCISCGSYWTQNGTYIK